MLVGVYSLSRATVWLTTAIAAWWLLVVGVIAATVPPPVGVGDLPAILPGRVGHIATPSGGAWPIPVDRATYYEVDRPAPDQNEDGTLDVRDRPGWLIVRHGQAVQVLDVDRAAVQVELLEEPNIGGQGWLHLEYLRP
jgi:hypothetical protein